MTRTSWKTDAMLDDMMVVNTRLGNRHLSKCSISCLAAYYADLQHTLIHVRNQVQALYVNCRYLQHSMP